MGGPQRSGEPDPDADLIRDLASEDAGVRRTALGDLYERHQGRVYNVAYRVLGSSADAQDVAQDVFLHVADRIRSFRGDSSLSSWIYRVTVNLAIDAKRRAARRPALRLTQPDGSDGDAGSPKPGSSAPPGDPSEGIQRREEERRVREALSQLSPKLQAVVVLRYMEGLAYEQLAEVLHCSMGTVKSRLNRAHAALERLLGRPPR